MTRRAEAPDPVSVVDAVNRDLEALARVDRALASSALALAARKLAEKMDDPANSATSVSMCAKALLDTLDKLRELTPKAQTKDALDELAAKRAERLVGGSAAQR